MGTFTNKKPDFTEPFQVRCVCGYELTIYPDMKRGGGYFSLCPWCPWQAEDLSVSEGRVAFQPEERLARLVRGTTE